MLRRLNYFIMSVLFIILVGCATVQPKFVDQMGREMPNPFYQLQTFGNPIYVSFYYTVYEGVKDIDGTYVGVPRYLGLGKHDLSYDKVGSIILTVEVQNPSRVRYTLNQEIEVDSRSENRVIKYGGETYKSNMEYRRYVYNLPTKDARSVDHFVSLRIEGDEVLRIGHFEYTLSQYFKSKEVMNK